jgi:hypothetical protein
VLNNWQKTPLSIVGDGLNYNIEKENEANEGDVWSDRKVRLENKLNKRILLSAAISVGSSSQSLKHMSGCLLQETQC